MNGTKVKAGTNGLLLLVASLTLVFFVSSLFMVYSALTLDKWEQNLKSGGGVFTNLIVKEVTSGETNHKIVYGSIEGEPNRLYPVIMNPTSNVEEIPLGTELTVKVVTIDGVTRVYGPDYSIESIRNYGLLVGFLFFIISAFGYRYFGKLLNSRMAKAAEDEPLNPRHRGKRSISLLPKSNSGLRKI